MKREILSCIMQYTKGIIEDDSACPETIAAFDACTITSGQIEDFIEEAREKTIAMFASSEDAP